MEKKDNKINKNSIQKLAASVQTNIQKLYKNTYFTGSENYSDLKNIKKNILKRHTLMQTV